MTHEHEAGGVPSDPRPGSVPSEWASPGSSLPRPPGVPPVGSSPGMPAGPPTASVEPVTEVVSTGPVTAEPSARPRWMGRVVAIVAALALVGGGGFLALNAASADGGADSPEGALRGVFDALSDEDFIGLAEYVEPAERETLLEAGFDMADELVRLELFDESLDLSSVDGIDLDYTDVEIDVVDVGPGLAHLFIEGGDVAASIDGAALPFGPLVTDRVDADGLAFDEQGSSRLTPTDVPIVAVERDGRWYVSLWYSVAENARLAAGAPLPDPGSRLAELGADSPEQAVALLTGATERLDLAAMIGMLDPQEMAALYDYAPLFLDDAQGPIDEMLAAVEDEGWSWEVTTLDLRSETDGDLATVFVDAVGFRVDGPEMTMAMDASSGGFDLSLESEGVSVEMTMDGDCIEMTVDEGFGPETEQMCGDDALGGLDIEGTNPFGGDAADVGIVVHRVDGRWYVSPLRTGSAAMLDMLRSLDPEAVAESVDSFASFLADPFALSSALGSDPFGELDGFDDLDGFEDLYEFDAGDDGFADDVPQLTSDNADLLVGPEDFLFVYDLAGPYRGDVWWQWLTDATEREFDRGVVAQNAFDDGSYYDVVVLDGVGVDSDESLVDWLGGEFVTVDGFTHLQTTNSWEDDLRVARSGDAIVIVNAYTDDEAQVVAALRAQVGG